MKDSSYRVLCCEGGDQVGKGDCILYFTKKMLSMNYPVAYASFPVYASPFGTLVRLFLQNDFKELRLDPLEDLKVKMSLYAINRLECMDILLSNPKFKDMLILFDRSPFSSAVTMSYGMSMLEDFQNDSFVEDMIKYALDMEKFMIQKLSLGGCVVQLINRQGNWKNERSGGKDIYETENVQMLVDMMYERYQKRIGKGWKKVVTRENGVWRDREDIFQEIYSFVLSRFGSVAPTSELEVKRYDIGIREMLGNVYLGCNVCEDLLGSFEKALLDNAKRDMYRYACEIGACVAKECNEIKFSNSGVRESIRSVLEANPRVLDVVSLYVGDEFRDKFCKAVYE